MRQYIYKFKGIAGKKDKSRGIEIGEEDEQCIMAVDITSATKKCTLTDWQIINIEECSDAWGKDDSVLNL